MSPGYKLHSVVTREICRIISRNDLRSVGRQWSTGVEFVVRIINNDRPSSTQGAAPLVNINKISQATSNNIQLWTTNYFLILSNRWQLSQPWALCYCNQGSTAKHSFWNDFVTMPSCGQSVNLWLWRCCLFVLFLHGTLTSYTSYLRSDQMMIWGLILPLSSVPYVMLVVVEVVRLEILPISVHSRPLAPLLPPSLPPYFTFQQVASSPQQCQDAACPTAAPTQPLLVSPQPPFFNLLSTTTVSQPLQSLGKSGEDFICDVFVLIIGGQSGNCILSSLDDKMLVRSSLLLTN